MTKGKKIFQPLTSENICEIYNLLHREGLVSFALTKDAQHKIDALVANINGKSFGVPHYPATEEKVFAYFYFIIKNHPFVDGNKRTASLVLLVASALNDLHRNLQNYGLDELAVFIEQLKEKDHHKVITDMANLLFYNR